MLQLHPGFYVTCGGLNYGPFFRDPCIVQIYAYLSMVCTNLYNNTHQQTCCNEAVEIFED